MVFNQWVAHEIIWVETHEMRNHAMQSLITYRRNARAY